MREQTEPIQLWKNDVRILSRMHELYEMGETRITREDLQRKVGIWDKGGECDMSGRFYIIRPRGNSAFNTSLGRLVIYGLVEQVKVTTDRDTSPSQNFMYKLPVAK